MVSVLPVIFLVGMGYARRWVTEDAFINLRVVQHVLAGYGPVFNAGERVEAFTSPLWIAILALWGALHGPLEIGSVWIGLALYAIGLVLAQTGAWHLAVRLSAVARGAAFGRNEIALPLGAAIFVSIPVVWDFATSGLETGLTMAWLGGTFWILARGERLSVRDARIAAFLIGCGPLIRPDLALFSTGFAAPLIVGVLSASGTAPSGRQWAQLAVIGAALPVGYEIFRMGYFAALVPNTALAKEASAAYWQQGWRYAKDFVLPYALWLPLAGAAAWAIALLPTARRSGPTDVALVIAPMCASLAHALYITRVGGDFMHGRLFLPSLLGFVLPVATVVVVVRPLVRWRAIVLAGIGIWVVVCAAWLRVPYWGHGRPGPGGIADERGFYTYHMRTPNPVYMADYLRHPYVTDFYEKILGSHRSILFNREHGLAADAALAPSVPASVRDVLGIMNVGVLGYLSGLDVHIADLLGLGDPLAARLILEDRSRPGHEKVLPDAWVVARFGDPQAARARFPDAPLAAQAMKCGDIALLLHAISDPLTPRRFLANIRDAWALHHLRIPADPAAAVSRFCPPSPTGHASAEGLVSG